MTLGQWLNSEYLLMVYLVGTNTDFTLTSNSYGFKQAYIPTDLLAWAPKLCELHHLTPEEKALAKHVSLGPLYSHSEIQLV